MAFNWQSVLGRLDPRKWRLSALEPAKQFVVTHRNTVLATSLALLVGLWSGAVLGRATAGGYGGSLLAASGVANHENPRSASAPRALPTAADGMAFVRLRVDYSAAQPRACLEFTRALSTDASVHYADYLTIDPDAHVNIDAASNLLCLGGLPFEPDRQVTIKKGLPAADGSKTANDETFTLTFGDRPAYVGFAGNGVILPRSEADGIAIETVNVSKIEVEVLRVPDRILSQYEVSPGEINEEGGWGSYSFDSAGEGVGVSIYKGEIDVAGSREHRNQAQTTVFALGASLRDLRAGAYIVKVKDLTPGAGANGENTQSPASAYRWVMYTDMALQTFSGASGLDLVVRSLKSARVMSGVNVALIAQNNDQLATARTDSNGHVHFNQALVQGDGPARARYVMAYGAGGDFAALDLNRPALDLTDRGIDGRRSAGDVDAYLYTERGVYRPGETVHLIGLVRDQVGRGIGDRPSTLVVYRPNGTEARRIRMSEAEDAGGILKNIPLDRSAPRGMWRAELTVDGQTAVAGTVSFSVEDFVPQRLRVRIPPDANQGVLRAGQSRPISLQADFLYGAPGAGLNVEAEGRLTVDENPFPQQVGYSWGKADESFDEQMFQLPATTTDGTGHADLAISLPTVPATSLPLRARVVVSVADPGGRMVRESVALPVRLNDLYLGLKPRFENRRAGAGQQVAYDVIAVNPDGQRIAANGVTWTLVREDWSYDWYLDGGSWKWRRTGRDIPVDAGTVNIAAGQPYTIRKDGLREGSYRLMLHQNATGVDSSQRFGVGWGGPADDDATPDMVTVVAPTDATRPGGRAHVQIRPPYAGEAEIVVATDRVIETRTMHVGTAGATIDLPVTAEWGPGAYVMVTVMTPRDPVNLPVPRRAVGVAYVATDMGGRTLQVAMNPGTVRPRTHIELPVQVRNAPGGERVYLAIAAVDEGILNLTKYDTPDPVAYFFGRRALGVDLRDDYGRLLNPNLGAPANARQGGDSLGGEGLTVVPTKTVSLFSSVVTLDGSGRARVPLDIPDFNGTLRLMAVAWSQTALGGTSQEVVVRDPVVAELIMPRFIAPGDEAQATLNVDNVEGPPGTYTINVAGSGAARVAAPPRRFQLNHGQRQTAAIPISSNTLGVGRVTIRLDGPAGFTSVEHSYDIQSRAPFLPITIAQTSPQAPQVSWRVPVDGLSRFQPTGQALISYSNLAGLDPAPLLDALYRYPYGCSEQLVSVGMPLLYFNNLAGDAHRQADPRLRQRLQDAATQLLDRQTTDGAFGLWRAGDHDATPWLGAYVTDFLTRAKAAGYVVPAAPMEQAYSALRTVARLNDFSSVGYQFEIYKWPGSNDSNELLRSRSAAYALYVLAKARHADIGQVRYFFDTRLRGEPSPLARAQIGAALTFLGDRSRAHAAFQMAEQALGYRNTGDWYQSPVRDMAGVMALAAEAGETDVVNRVRQRMARDVPDANALMTQEQVQLLLAANALRQQSGDIHVSLNGQVDAGNHVTANAQRLIAGMLFRNDGRGPAWRTFQVSGPPREAPPAMASGFSVDKHVYTMNGAGADLNGVRQGDRVVVVVTGRPEGARNYPTVLVDLLPAGLEIETVLGPSDGHQAASYDGTTREGPFAWVGTITSPGVSEARDDRYVASANLHDNFTFAYIARAVTPGRYTMPAAQVEDMYRPGVMARSSTGAISIAPR